MSNPRQRRPAVRYAVSVAFIAYPLLFAYAVRENLAWLLWFFRLTLWVTVVIGYLNLFIYMRKYSLEFLAMRARERKVGWLMFITNAGTIALSWSQGWHALATAHTLILVFGFVARFIGAERLDTLEKSLPR